MSIETLIEKMAERGYRQECPPRTGLVDGASIDRQVCEESQCECGWRGMYYLPFYNHKLESYRAFAVCGKCRRYFEF